MCRELAELAMELARAAARRTLQAWQAEEAAEPANNSKAPAPAARAARASKTPDPGLLFARLSTAARQAIALEARIAAGPVPARRGTDRASRPPPDERRATLRQVLRDATEHHPDRTTIRRDITDSIEAQIAADPAGEIHMGDMLDTICEYLGIEINWSKIHDEVLEKLTALAPKNENETLPPAAAIQAWHQTPILPRAGPP